MAIKQITVIEGHIVRESDWCRDKEHELRIDEERISIQSLFSEYIGKNVKITIEYESN